MAKEKKRLLAVDAKGNVKLPADALEAIGHEDGEQVQLFVDTRRKQIRLERHVDDPWEDAFKKKDEKGFGDLMSEQKAREDAAADLFDRKMKDPPKLDKKKPEDDPDYWR
ncbi:MAG: hypothetical protein ACYTGN_04475 [Planctomycetota bacterium]|jgi:bifunctional DNA-binding transcriptional regulator/antitoxin component of YhaV-PrlF toxin-antitoxin module